MNGLITRILYKIGVGIHVLGRNGEQVAEGGNGSTIL